MQGAEAWFICRIGFVETVRAVGLAVGTEAAERVREEWPSFGVVEVTQELAEHAAQLTMAHDLRSMDALHLAAALLLPRDRLMLATWDRRLHAAALAHELAVLPEGLD
jgi:hypothetical protein